MTLTLLSAEYLAMLMKFMISSRLNVVVLKLTSKSEAFVLNVKDHQPTTQSFRFVSVLLVKLLTLLVTALLDAELMKFSRMVFAAAKMDITQSEEFVDNVPGMKFTTKDLDFAESPVTTPEFTILVSRNVFASQNYTKWLMEPVTNVSSTQHTIQSPRLASAMQDISKTSVSAPLHAMPMKILLTENVSAKKDIISLDTAVDYVLLLRFMTQFTESVITLVPKTKSGILSSDHADVSLDSTLSTMFALNAILGLKSTATELDAVIVLLDIEKLPVKDVMANVLLFAHPTKITS